MRFGEKMKGTNLCTSSRYENDRVRERGRGGEEREERDG